MFSPSDLHTECECKAMCCVGIILRQRNTIQLRCFVTMQLFHWLLSQTKRPAFLQFSLLSFFCLSPPPKNKETYTVILNGEKNTARVRPNPFLFEILNSIYHPRARSSSTLSLLPCWGEQRGLDVVTEWFLGAAARVRGQLREAYALLRLAEKKKIKILIQEDKMLVMWTLAEISHK